MQFFPSNSFFVDTLFLMTRLISTFCIPMDPYESQEFVEEEGSDFVYTAEDDAAEVIDIEADNNAGEYK